MKARHLLDTRKSNKKVSKRPKQASKTSVPAVISDVDAYGDPCPEYDGLFIQFMEAKTLYSFFNVMKDFFDHIELVCDPDKMSIHSVCSKNIALMTVEMMKKEGGDGGIQWYQCDRPVALGIDTASFTKLLKIAPMIDRVRIYADYDYPRSIEIEFGNNFRKSAYIMNLVDIHQDSLQIPEWKSCPSIIRMPSAIFYSICNNTNAISKANTIALETKSDGGFYIMISDADLTDTFITGGEVIYTNMEKGIEITINETISLDVSLQYVLGFSKMYSVSDEVIIWLDSELPVRFDYTIGTIGTCSFYLAPKLKVDEYV